MTGSVPSFSHLPSTPSTTSASITGQAAEAQSIVGGREFGTPSSKSCHNFQSLPGSMHSSPWTSVVVDSLIGGQRHQHHRFHQHHQQKYHLAAVQQTVRVYIFTDTSLILSFFPFHELELNDLSILAPLDRFGGHCFCRHKTGWTVATKELRPWVVIITSLPCQPKIVIVVVK
ncbi:hypothetical protein TYRP_009214 [Tyrophagus putrescentiae]|nr:hypothetical protein TYRP_009214 [Tyrophagus putrescentiae]